MTEHTPVPHPYKLRSIEMQDFKSIAHAKIDFSPLTVIVGANSSGKSSLIQAILALSQTVRSEDLTARFPLNGEFVRLGTFEEVKNYASEVFDSPIKIAVLLQAGDKHILTGGAATLDEAMQWLGLTARETLDGDYVEPPLPQVGYDEDGVVLEENYALWSLNLTDDETSSNSMAKIDSLQLKAFKEYFSEPTGNIDDKIEVSIDCNLSGFTPDFDKYEPPKQLQIISENLLPLKTSGQITQDPWWWSMIFDGPMKSYTGFSKADYQTETHSCDAVAMVGGIPHAVFTKRSEIESCACCWWDHAIDGLSGEVAVSSIDEDLDLFFQYIDRTESGVSTADTIAVDLAENQIRQSRESSEQHHSRDIVETLATIVRRDLDPYVSSEILPDEYRLRIGISMLQLGEVQFRRLLKKRFEGESWASEISLDESEPYGLGGQIGFAESRELQNYFKNSIKYLGPLRATPRLLYDYASSRFDIGINGENAASVLHIEADQEVLVPDTNGSPKRTDLSSALAYWLQEFRIANSTQTEDHGRLGFGLKVSPPTLDKPIDLTSVGVGVSQILPVILLCLLAEPGELVILEQPELHLHPALQHKLADFLLECTRSGRQILVETHSEHLINRLRRRVSEDDSDKTQSLVGLLFAEQHEGQTTFKESKINAYGGLSEDWPDGFLDIGAREAQSLVRSSVYKYRRRKNLDEPSANEKEDDVEP